MQASDIRHENDEGLDDRRLLRSVMVGVAAGLVASWIMEQFQAATTAVAPEGTVSADTDDEPATVKAADAANEAVTGEPLPEHYKEPAGSAVHYGFGAFLGGLYGAVGYFRPTVRAGFGTVYGAGVAVVADEALVPAMGLAPGPQDVPAGTHAYGIISHLVFGAALEGSSRAIERIVSPRSELARRREALASHAAPIDKPRQ